MKQKNKIIGLSAAVCMLVIFSPKVSLGMINPEEITVENCVKRTGLTEEKCQEMIDKFNNMTDEEKEAMRSRIPGGEQGRLGGEPPKGGEGPKSDKKSEEKNPGENASSLEEQIKRAQRMKEQKENQFSRIEKRVEKIIEFLKSKDVDTTEIETSLGTFKEKAEAVLGAFDTYIQFLENSKTDTTITADILKEKRAEIKNLIKELTSFYRDALREKIKNSLDKLEQ